MNGKVSHLILNWESQQVSCVENSIKNFFLHIKRVTRYPEVGTLKRC